jgi:FtsH-binding integral membrane protein
MSQPAPTDPAHSPDQPSDENPRAFSQGTGYVLQIVGLILTFGGCCVCSLLGWYQDETDVPINSPADYFAQPNLSLALAALNLFASFAGGLGLLGAGIGLQGDRPRSGKIAMAVTATLALIFAATAAVHLFITHSLAPAITAAVFAAAMTLLFLLAGNSARVLRENPAPEDANAVPPDYVDPLTAKKNLPPKNNET